MKPRARAVYLIDDDADVREALSFLLRTMGFTVEPFVSALKFLERPDPKRDGVIVVDVRMPGVSGLQLLERVAAEGEYMPVVVITGHGDVNACRRAFKAGAVDFLTKPIDEYVLIEAIETALMQLEERDQRRVETAQRDALLTRLTPREREILEMVARGLTTKEIARALELSPRTVETHRANMADKLGTASVAEIVRLVLQDGHGGAAP